MTVAMKKQLDESLRDAQLAYYLNQIVQDSDRPGTVRLKTAQDLYEYWLLDVLVSQDVPTTPVACAIASLQQYINRILMNMEPGYDQANITPEQMQTWRNEMHQYPVWAAHQKLLYFPASYLDPVLRNKKSDNFQQLENELNQNRIQTDAVQSAVMAYLTRFEEIANLNILNGYIDGEDFANSTYYFIAKSRTENTYFWRTLNMGQRPLDGTSLAIARKLDQPDPFAWSDWKKADVPIPDDTAEHSIRPVWFNNRLFVVWAECIQSDPAAVRSDSSLSQTGTIRPLFRLNFCFKKTDGCWSTPRVCLQGYGDETVSPNKPLVATKASMRSIALQYHNGSRDLLFLALCVQGTESESKEITVIGNICINKNLTPERETKDAENDPCPSVNRMLASATQRIQISTSSRMTAHEINVPANMLQSMSNFREHQDQIRATATVTNSGLRLHVSSDSVMKLSLWNSVDEDKIELWINGSCENTTIKIALRLSKDNLTGDYTTLEAGSKIFVSSFSPFGFYILSFDDMSNVLKKSNEVPLTWSDNTADLEGRLISTAVAQRLIKLGRRDFVSGEALKNIKLQMINIEPKVFNVIRFDVREKLNAQYMIFRLPRIQGSKPLTYQDLREVAKTKSTPTPVGELKHILLKENFNPDNEILLCGVVFSSVGEEDKKVGSAFRAMEIGFADALLRPPSLKDVSTSELGTSQFIDFTNSTVSKNDTQETPRHSIRLNTVFAAELIRRTENGLDELFDWTTQHLPEPTTPDGASNGMDFHGPYGRYFTELFLYLPWLVAHRLNAEQRYEEAELWLRRVFDPGRGKERCWRAVPLLDNSTPSYADQAPHDPHQIALSHPAHFRKALYFLYLDILINRGDAAYRELTPDGLSEAKLWYARVLDLLGPRPIVQSVDHWESVSLKTLSETTSDDLRTFEQSLAHPQPSFPVRGGSQHASLPTIDSPHLRLPFHPQLLQCWDIAESRLYNLRHNLDIAGKPLHLPIFAAPLDPRVLLSPAVLNTSDDTVRRLPGTAIPHYRFSVMHNQALSAVESLSQFGTTLLSLIERKEQAQLQELQQQQAWNLAKISVDLQRQAVNIDRQNRQALLASQAIAQNRLTHYKKLLDDGLSRKEMDVSAYSISSGSFEAAALAFQVAAGYTMLAPNMVGICCVGGSRWEGPLLSASAAAHSAAIINRTIAADLDRQAIFDRRREDWQHTYDQSQLELAQIDAQLAQFTEQETATRLQLRLAETTLSQTKANYDFLSKRFTKAQLYQWLNSQFAALYRQAYDTTLALCFAAENCWQYEIADFTRRFIQPGAWNTTYRGLGAGDQLKLSLLNMQAEYLRRSGRELEIRKTISLRQLQSQSTDSAINKQWADIQANLLKTGKCDFELTHKLFEDDYKEQKHYLRRIKTISVSLPAVVGPYENIRATLAQVSSKVFMSPDDANNVMKGLRANQQIALSTGVDDNGLFTLNFNDERYLPFEYTGAISKWQLTFPNPEAQKDLLESLTDIIVHVSYTARAGGAQ